MRVRDSLRSMPRPRTLLVRSDYPPKRSCASRTDASTHCTRLRPSRARASTWRRYATPSPVSEQGTRSHLVRLRFPTRDIPSRLATGAFVLHAGIEKWKGAPELAAGVHGMAAGAFPFLRRIPPTAFLRLLAASEIATGALLLPPIVPNAVAGAPLTAFSASLLAMYLRTEALHKPGSVWPTPAGIALSKDIWMLGTGLTLLLDQAGTR